MPLGFLVALAYFAGMWAKGTTIGGIVLGLKVVRVDGQPVTFVVALVRALAAAFSAVVLFLGFLWIAWDIGWHDRIAGTVLVACLAERRWSVSEPEEAARWRSLPCWSK